MNVVRWTAAGLVFGIGPYLPNVGTDWVILLGAYLFSTSALLTIVTRRARGHAERSVAAHAAMASDALAGMGAVLVFSPAPEAGVMVAVGVVLIGTGALRGGIGGAVATLVATCAAYAGGAALRVERGEPADLGPAFVTVAAYAFTAVVFIGWHADLHRALTESSRVAARLTHVERLASDVIYEWDIATGQTTISDAAATQLGYELGSRPLDRSWWEERLHPDDAGPVRDALSHLLRGATPEWDMDYRFRKADGTYATVHDRGYIVTTGGRKPRPLRMVGSLVNVDSLSLYDGVTRLAGRALFSDRVERRALRVALRDTAGFAVLAMDIERWRERSAELGQERAQEIVIELARRLERYVREGETIARIATDRFALLVNAPTAEDAIARAAQVRDSARIPFNGEVRLDVHVGAAVLADGGGAELLSQSFAGLADAKRTGRRVALYEPGGEQRWDRRLELRDDLRGAIQRRELGVSFQPIVDVRTGRCVAVEALARWQHPEHGELDAADLMPIAADLELRAEIDRYVLQDATRSLSQLRRAMPDLRVSVNLSPGSLDEGIATSVRALLASALLPGDALTIDVTEDPRLENGPAAKALAELRDLNVDVALDDAGTGYASTILTAIPATDVKVDRVFTSRILKDEQAEVIVRSAVVRAHDRGMRVVAEGVEDPALVPHLRELGVDLMQGRAIAEPMPLDALAGWLRPAAAA